MGIDPHTPCLFALLIQSLGRIAWVAAPKIGRIVFMGVAARAVPSGQHETLTTRPIPVSTCAASDVWHIILSARDTILREVAAPTAYTQHAVAHVLLSNFSTRPPMLQSVGAHSKAVAKMNMLVNGISASSAAVPIQCMPSTPAAALDAPPLLLFRSMMIPTGATTAC